MLGRRRELGGRILTGGWMQVSQNYLPPNSDFSLDLAHFILKILENPKVYQIFRKFSLKTAISGGILPRNFEAGDTSRQSNLAGQEVSSQH